MIAGTNFVLAGFDAMLRSMTHRARRFVDRDARIQARAPNAVCLESKDGMVSIALQPAPDGTMRAFVLVAIADSPHGAFKRNEAAIVAIAKDMGASSLAFRSGRRGWSRVLGPDWKQTGDTFERRL